MVTVHFTKTWWEKTHLSIMPNTLRALLEVNGRVSFRDPDTKKIINFTARDILNNPELKWDKEYNEYVFPIN